MLQTFLLNANQDFPVFIGDVRKEFQKEGVRPFHIHVHSFQGDERVFPLMMPVTNTTEEDDFVAAYIHAHIYNILSALGAVRMDVYVDSSDAKLLNVANKLSDVFQIKLPKAERTGYGKCVNVNDRTLAALTEGVAGFEFQIFDMKSEPAMDAGEEKKSANSIFFQLPEIVKDKVVLGIDIGGTDIKLAVSVWGELAFCKEFDWFPTSFTRVEQFIYPVVLLTRLMRAAASAKILETAEKFSWEALDKNASFADMEKFCELVEEEVGDAICTFDAIGVSFPDVVIRDRIVGGETYKTRGMRENAELDYEVQFAKITELRTYLASFVKEQEMVRLTNDGHVAAYTVAVEQAYVGTDCSAGVFAHTLGTELGTGWVNGDGTIPEIPAEVYNFIIDLGSFKQREFEADDARSINNFNTQLPGTLQKYTSQYGAFRLAAKYLHERNVNLYQEIFDRGMLCLKDGKLLVPTEPVDMRKPYLEFLMGKAAEGDEVCERIFREIGAYLSVTWEETMFILEPRAVDRTLFGRLVKNPACFTLLSQGACERTPQLKQFAADGTLANTKLMKQLEAHPDYTVAQFAQAIGAIYFGCRGCLGE